MSLKVIYDSYGNLIGSMDESAIKNFANATFIVDYFDDYVDSYYIDGEIKHYSSHQIEAKNNNIMASPHWDNVAMAWIDVRTLSQKQDAAWARIKAARDAALSAPVTWDGSTFDADEKAQQRIGDALQLAAMAVQAGQAYSVPWTLADNTVRVLSGADLAQVAVAMGLQFQATFAKGQALRAQIEAATTQAELDAVIW